jgi:hypothetical protein
MGSPVIELLLSCYDAVQRAFGPELSRLDNLRVRVRMCERAWHRTIGFSFLIYEASFVFCALGVFLLSKQYFPMWVWKNPHWEGCVFVATFIIMVLPSSLFLRRRYRRSLRIELFSIGVPICIHCGYDLTGNTSGICPECGTPIPKGSFRHYRGYKSSPPQKKNRLPS